MHHTSNPVMEEFPQRHEVANETDLVPDHELCAQCPPEEAKVTRMSEPRVYPFRHQHMSLFSDPGNYVIEIGASGFHGESSDHLA